MKIIMYTVLTTALTILLPFSTRAEQSISGVSSGADTGTASVSDTVKKAAPVQENKKISENVKKAVEKAAAEVKQSTEEAKKEIEEAVQEMKEELSEIREDSIEEAREHSVKADTVDASFIAERINTGISVMNKTRVQGYGGGVSISPSIVGLSIEPVKDLIAREHLLNDYTFNDFDRRYRILMGSGVLVYGGVGRGIRIGFAGAGCEFSTASETHNDTIAVLWIKQNFNGFLVEKAFVQGNLNFVAGGVLGLGSLEVTRDFDNSSNPTAFRSFWSEKPENAEKAKATLAGFSVHCGGTFTMLPWLHMGADVNVQLTTSTGFGGPGDSGFFMATPALRFRIVLGNIG